MLLRELNAGIALAFRDLLKFLRDPARLISTFIFPFVFIGILGGSMDASFGEEAGMDFLTFVFTGILAQTLFQSSALGIISLIEDRENDFSQEVFVAPISRYTIILGKIVGESLVAMAQGLGILVFALVLGIGIPWARLPLILAACLVAAFFGGAFGVLVLGNLASQRAANQVFPFIMLPQFFLAGVFNRIDVLPPVLDFLSRISPMRYAVDLVRGVYYPGLPDEGIAVAATPSFNLMVSAVLFVVFLAIGTARFVKPETER